MKKIHTLTIAAATMGFSTLANASTPPETYNIKTVKWDNSCKSLSLIISQPVNVIDVARKNTGPYECSLTILYSGKSLNGEIIYAEYKDYTENGKPRGKAIEKVGTIFIK